MISVAFAGGQGAGQGGGWFAALIPIILFLLLVVVVVRVIISKRNKNTNFTAGIRCANCGILYTGKEKFCGKCGDPLK